MYEVRENKVSSHVLSGGDFQVHVGVDWLPRAAPACSLPLLSTCFYVFHSRRKDTAYMQHQEAQDSEREERACKTRLLA